MKKLIIVESPSKAKTIKKILGNNFEILASYGHIKDLPKSKLGVKVEEGFEPIYEIIPDKKKILQSLLKAAEKAEEILLASDPDREGEAIAWHLKEELEKKNINIKRATFHEITERGVKEGIEKLRELDSNLYQAQKARRVLDRLVGYKISPLLWEKVKRGTSAGRVQSVALRLIVDREKEIRNFVPEEYWTVEALFNKDRRDFRALLVSINGKKVDIRSRDEANRIKNEIEGREFEIFNIEKRKRKKSPPPPYTTSTLQQDAFRKLGFSTSKTMSLAQRLYEGIELGPYGRKGLITYMRTDSVRVSEEAVINIRRFVEERWGKNYLSPTPRVYRNRESAQDAHEAIRPTYFDLPPEKVNDFMKKDEFKLYELIWKRFVASQMSDAEYESTSVELVVDSYHFKVTGSILVFPGFLEVYEMEAEEETILPYLEKGEILKPKGIVTNQHFTKPPPRYNEGSLVKTLEEKGIGRPSTYATIISTLKERKYIKVDKKRLIPTELGEVVCELLMKHFPEVMRVDFTAKMERNLDLVERGEEDWRKMVGMFYSIIEKYLKEAEKNMISLKKSGIQTSLKCPECGSALLIKIGKGGSFLSCSRYPECSYSSDFERNEKGEIIPLKEKKAGECPVCGKPLVVKKSKKGVRFISCSDYPSCNYTASYRLEEKCPLCGAHLVERISKKGKIFYGCERFPECRFIKKERKKFTS